MIAKMKEKLKQNQHRDAFSYYLFKEDLKKDLAEKGLATCINGKSRALESMKRKSEMKLPFDWGVAKLNHLIAHLTTIKEQYTKYSSDIDNRFGSQHGNLGCSGHDC